MVASVDPGTVKVYTVNGAASGSSSSLPDWLTRKRATKGKGKRAAKEVIEGSLELIQHFEFPEASMRIRTTRDGHHAIATGVYKPQMRVYDLDQLSMKFERHSDAENVDFIILSDDWTKTLHLQADRSIELHTQGGFYYRTRIPRFCRTLGYHFQSCDALVAGTGPEVYRLNLEQGRFMNPLFLEGEGGESISGINCIDINPVHQLFSFGVEGNGTVEMWDPRSRSRVGILRLPRSQLLPSTALQSTLPGVDTNDLLSHSLSVTAIASRPDGLSYAVGTSSGHTLLYDIRSPQPYAMKDQGYGLPVKTLTWIEGGSRMAGDGMVLSADKKVIKIWDRNSPTSNFASVTPATDLNHVHHLPGSGLIMTANEGIQMSTLYIPQLGPAPKWCSFLENVTEEMEDQAVRNVYEDYKFVERSELSALGLDHLIGTPALKPYMHGYFLQLKLYDAARVIANPFAYAEHRERLIREKLDKAAETRIRSRKDGAAAKVKINKGLAEKIRKDEEKEAKKLERKRARILAAAAAAGGEEDEEDAEMEEAEEEHDEAPTKPSMLTDPRFQALFEDPDFQVDEESRAFELANPATAAAARTGKGRTRTAVESEEDESGGDEDNSDEDGADEDDQSTDDSSVDGNLESSYAAVAQPPVSTSRPSRPRKGPNLVPMKAQATGARSGVTQKETSFGQRLRGDDVASASSKSKGRGSQLPRTSDGGMEMSWVPSSTAADDAGFDSDDMLVPGNRKDGGIGKTRAKKVKGVEMFGAGMQRGVEELSQNLAESDRSGRKQRRQVVRSGSKNVFRRL